MKKARNHFAVVVDEYGGMSGIITINDLLEQLVGDLDDDITAPGRHRQSSGLTRKPGASKVPLLWTR